MDKKFVIIGGPTADNLIMIFQLQHKDCIMDPPFATLRVKNDDESQDLTPEIDLAFYPTKMEYLDDTGQRFGIAGYISCISTTRGFRESRSMIYAGGHYSASNGIGLLNVDYKTYEVSDFKKQFETEINKRISMTGVPFCNVLDNLTEIA